MLGLRLDERNYMVPTINHEENTLESLLNKVGVTGKHRNVLYSHINNAGLSEEQVIGYMLSSEKNSDKLIAVEDILLGWAEEVMPNAKPIEHLRLVRSFKVYLR